MGLATIGKGNYCWGFYQILFWNKELETLNCQIDIMPYVSLYASPFDAAFTGEKSYKPEITENESLAFSWERHYTKVICGYYTP